MKIDEFAWDRETKTAILYFKKDSEVLTDEERNILQFLVALRNADVLVALDHIPERDEITKDALKKIFDKADIDIEIDEWSVKVKGNDFSFLEVYPVEDDPDPDILFVRKNSPLYNICMRVIDMAKKIKENREERRESLLEAIEKDEVIDLSEIGTSDDFKEATNRVANELARGIARRLYDGELSDAQT